MANRHLTQLARKGGNPLNFEFVEHYKVIISINSFSFSFRMIRINLKPSLVTAYVMGAVCVQTTAFTFTSSSDDSVWNLDGEPFQAHKLSAQVFRGLINLFASGPEV